MLFCVSICLLIGIAYSVHNPLRLATFGDLSSQARARSIETLTGGTLSVEETEKSGIFIGKSHLIAVSNETLIHPELVCAFISGSSLTNEDIALGYFESCFRSLKNLSNNELNANFFIIHNFDNNRDKNNIRDTHIRLLRQAALNVAQENRYLEKTGDLKGLLKVPIKIIFRYNNDSFSGEDIKACRLLLNSTTVSLSNINSRNSSRPNFVTYNKSLPRTLNISNPQVHTIKSLIYLN